MKLREYKKYLAQKILDIKHQIAQMQIELNAYQTQLNLLEKKDK